MNCLIIDDDKVSRILFEKYISKTEFLVLKGSFGSAIDAIPTLQTDDDIDLIFLDIEMPEMSGLELLKTLEAPPMVIVISAKERYAIEAIEFNVIDYLLKPVSFARFFKAVSKASTRSKNSNIQPINDEGVFIRSSLNSFVRIKYDDILWVEALENYVVINTYEEKYTIHFTMKSVANKLPAKKFIRIHRSFIVNIDKVYLIEDFTVKVKTAQGNKILPIAKSLKNNLMETINVISR